MLVRMADTQASEAARSLANARWRGQVVSRAIATLEARSTELSDAQLADLRAIADRQEGLTDE
jgi:hypothetical protein